MSLCNGCGDCCNPLVLADERIKYLVQWAHRPDPEEQPEFYEPNGFDCTDPAIVAKIREHIANGKFLVDHWIANIFAKSSTQVHVRCPFYSPSTGWCTNYANRPPICVGYPWYDETPEGRCARGAGPEDRCGYYAEVPVALRPRGWKLLKAEDIVHA